MKTYMSDIAEQMEDEKYICVRTYNPTYRTLASFKRICQVVGNLKKDEIAELEQELRKRHSAYKLGVMFHFSYEDMYEVFTSNPIAKKKCEKYFYNNWEDIIKAYEDHIPWREQDVFL